MEKLEEENRHIALLLAKVKINITKRELILCELDFLY